VNALAKGLAFVAALCGVVFGLAGLVRAAALAADEGVVWEAPGWWAELLDGGGSSLLTLLAVAFAAAAALYLVVAVRQLAPPGAPATARVGDVDVKMAALERMVSQRLATEVAGLTPLRVRVTWADDGWDVNALVDARPRDLAGIRDQAVAVTGAELHQATGRDLGRLTLEVRRFAGHGE